MKKDAAKAKITFLLSMLIFSTVGIVRKQSVLPSGFLSLCRGLIGFLMMGAVMLVRRKKDTFPSIRRNLWKLIASGCCLGMNWVFLFESYSYTSVAVATVCYYMAPIFVLIVAPYLLKEKLNWQKKISIPVAMVGLVFISGVLQGTQGNRIGLVGISFALLAAVLYATLVILNKKMDGIDGIDRTTVQLGVSALVLVPYVLLKEGIPAIVSAIRWIDIPIVLILGVAHTGVAYTLYFASMQKLEAQTVSLLSYIDPVGAVLLSIFLLGEKPNLFAVIGIVLILLATLVSEVKFKKKVKTE